MPVHEGDRLSRGQVLSVVVVACGISMAAICARRQVPRIGGLPFRRNAGA